MKRVRINKRHRMLTGPSSDVRVHVEEGHVHGQRCWCPRRWGDRGRLRRRAEGANGSPFPSLPFPVLIDDSIEGFEKLRGCDWGLWAKNRMRPLTIYGWWGRPALPAPLGPPRLELGPGTHPKIRDDIPTKWRKTETIHLRVPLPWILEKKHRRKPCGTGKLLPAVPWEESSAVNFSFSGVIGLLD